MRDASEVRTAHSRGAARPGPAHSRGAARSAESQHRRTLVGLHDDVVTLPILEHSRGSRQYAVSGSLDTEDTLR